MCPYKGIISPPPPRCATITLPSNIRPSVRPSVEPCCCSHGPTQWPLSVLGTHWIEAWGNLWRRISEGQKPESPVGCRVFPLSLRRNYYLVHQSQDEPKDEIPPPLGRIANRRAGWSCHGPLVRPPWNLKSLGPRSTNDVMEGRGKQPSSCLWGSRRLAVHKTHQEMLERKTMACPYSMSSWKNGSWNV